MRLAALAVLSALAAAAPAQSATVQVMVVGKSRVLRTPQTVRLKARIVRAGGRRCAVAAATPLAALVGTGLKLRIRDEGACGRLPRDSASLYVTQVGPDRAHGRAGWVYKVDRRAGTTGAADLSGPFGTGRRLRGGQRVLWFWCVLDRADSCQRTLEAGAPRTVAPGTPVRVTVRGYDDRGRGVPVARATVRLGRASAVTVADGSATLTAPATAARARLTAEHAGMVQAFPREVRVG